jgi:hypothetical protein
LVLHRITFLEAQLFPGHQGPCRDPGSQFSQLNKFVDIIGEMPWWRPQNSWSYGFLVCCLWFLLSGTRTCQRSGALANADSTRPGTSTRRSLRSRQTQIKYRINTVSILYQVNRGLSLPLVCPFICLLFRCFSILNLRGDCQTKMRDLILSSASTATPDYPL